MQYKEMFQRKQKVFGMVFNILSFIEHNTILAAA